MKQTKWLLSLLCLIPLFLDACAFSDQVTSSPVPTYTAIASPPIPDTPTSVLSIPTLTQSPAPSPTYIGPTPTITGAIQVAFPIGIGGSDSIPHQIVRTGNDYVYIFANQQTSNMIRVYRTVTNGLPSSTADFVSLIQLTESSNPISVDTAYDGGTIIHVLVNLQNGQAKDYPFDVSINAFKSPITLATDGGTVDSSAYVGTCGIAGMVDLDGKLHVVYWTNENHILSRTYFYNASLNTLKPTGDFTQVDSAGSSNHPAVAVSPLDNSLTIAWVSEATYPAKILARTRTASGIWGDIEIVSTSPVWTYHANGINIDQSPNLLIDSTGMKHLVYIQLCCVLGGGSYADYGLVHYVANSGLGWVDTALSLFTHDPAIAISDSDSLYIIGHGHPNNLGGNAACRSMDNMCFSKLDANGTWGDSTLLIQPSTGNSFDSSPSVKWSVMGFNRPESIEFVFFQTPYDAPLLYYARLP